MSTAARPGYRQPRRNRRQKGSLRAGTGSAGAGAGAGRVRDHSERAPGKAQIGSADLHDDHRCLRETRAQCTCPSRMQFDRNDPGAGGDKLAGDRTRSRADVEHQIAGTDAGLNDEAPRGVVRELVPAPARPPAGGGHDAPSP